MREVLRDRRLVVAATTFWWLFLHRLRPKQESNPLGESFPRDDVVHHKCFGVHVSLNEAKRILITNAVNRLSGGAICRL